MIGRGLAALSRAGLRWRLAGWVAVVVLACTAVTFAAVYRGTGTQLRGQIDRELGGASASLAHALRSPHSSSPQRVAQAAARYINPSATADLGVLLASSVTYIEAVFAERTSYAVAMAATAATVFVMASVAAAVGPERRGAEFGA